MLTFIKDVAPEFIALAIGIVKVAGFVEEQSVVEGTALQQPTISS